MSNLLNNLPNFAIEEQTILKEQLENVVKEISSIFNPEQIEKLAVETNFVRHESKLTGLLFLSLFVFGVSMYGNPTLEQLIGLLNTYVKELTLSRPGLHQRINAQAVAFFEKLLSLAIERTIPDRLKINLPAQFAGIQIWDSTSFQLPDALAPFFTGKGGSASRAGAKIQFRYDFNRHKWGYAIQSATEADNSMADNIVALTQPGDLLLQDLGYFNVEIFASLHSKDAYYLSRCKHDVNIYQQNEDGSFSCENLVTLLQRYQFIGYLELPVFLRSKHNVFTPTRLIIERLPEQAVNQRLRKLNKEARSRGKQLSADAIFLAHFNFYVTNASSDLLPASCCRFLYSIRWQIELIFKAWKSHLQVHKIHVKHRPERVKVTILGKLIFITITAQMICLATAFLWHISQLEISYYRALRHLQTAAERWFSFVIQSNFRSIFALLVEALAFIQKRSFKIPQHNRLYPLEKLQLFGDLLLTT